MNAESAVQFNTSRWPSDIGLAIWSRIDCWQSSPTCEMSSFIWSHSRTPVTITALNRPTKADV